VIEAMKRAYLDTFGFVGGWRGLTHGRFHRHPDFFILLERQGLARFQHPILIGGFNR